MRGELALSAPDSATLPPAALSATAACNKWLPARRPPVRRPGAVAAATRAAAGAAAAATAARVGVAVGRVSRVLHVV
eukprot:365942-Chlamydomonas_euryale.AAC.80